MRDQPSPIPITFCVLSPLSSNQLSRASMRDAVSDDCWGAKHFPFAGLRRFRLLFVTGFGLVLTAKPFSGSSQTPGSGFDARIFRAGSGLSRRRAWMRSITDLVWFVAAGIGHSHLRQRTQGRGARLVGRCAVGPFSLRFRHIPIF